MLTVQGRSIWDPRVGPSTDPRSWRFSENPALVMLDMILEHDTKLPSGGFMDQLLKAADLCDQATTNAD